MENNKKEYVVWGRVVLDIEMYVDASTKDEALQEAMEVIEDYYRIGEDGAYHNRHNTEFGLYADETVYDEDEE